MSFSFKYKPITLKTGKIIHRPIIPLTIEGMEKMDILAVLDSGSDMTIIPKEMAERIDIRYTGENEIYGIGRIPIKTREGKIHITFGKGRENYSFDIPVLVPVDKEDVPIIIGRIGFFNQFKIIFSESEKKIEFKKVESLNIAY